MERARPLSTALAVVSPVAACAIICTLFIVWVGFSTARSIATSETTRQGENVSLIAGYIEHLISDATETSAALDRVLAARQTLPSSVDLGAFLAAHPSPNHTRSIALVDRSGRVLATNRDQVPEIAALLPEVIKRIDAGAAIVTLPLPSHDDPNDIPNFLYVHFLQAKPVLVVFDIAAGIAQRHASIRVADLDAGFALMDSVSLAAEPFGRRPPNLSRLRAERSIATTNVPNTVMQRCTGASILNRRCEAYRALANSTLVLAAFVDNKEIRSNWIREDRPFWLFAFLVMLGGAASSVLIWLWMRDRREDRRQLAEALDQLKSAYASKSNFMAHLSHELRTPLNSIVGFSDLIRGAYFGPVDERYRSYAEDIHSSALHLHNIAADIMDLERLERGELPPEPGSADLNVVIADATRMLSVLAAKRNIAVELNPWPSPAEVGMGPHRVLQIAINLLSNAIKYSEPGDRVQVGVNRDGNGTFSLAVTDEGIGMTAEEIAYTERPFGQPADRRSGRHESIGLGLPIVRGLLAATGGALHIESEKNRGTKVCAVFSSNCAA